MSDKKDGGPAFPSEAGSQNFGRSGMTLRDWFAGQALAGIAADYIEADAVDASEYASACGELADAMLAEREK